MSHTPWGWLSILVLAALSPGTPRLCAQDYHDSVVIVLDASGSMKDRMPGGEGSKMAAAKTALKTVLRQIPPTTHIGLLVFSARDVRDPWVYRLGPRNDEELTSAIDRLEPYGNTPLGRHIKQGADRLLEERAAQFGYGTYRLLVVTDGEAQDQNLVDRYAPEVLARGITMDVIGVAMRQDHTLARKAHSYRRANDAASLERAVAEVLAEVSRPRTDTAQADAFVELASLPPEVAAAALQALSASGNHPIGERPRQTAPPESTRSADDLQPAAGTPVPPAAPAPAAPPGPSRPPRGGSSGGPSWLIILAFVAAFVFVVIRRLFKGR
ncbi:MAG TPA: VWA domain-containing protein [Verrucomicrobiota bacterium]|nr:VWA domain-containing protein [Verrucomicrobiota bacterium]